MPNNPVQIVLNDEAYIRAPEPGRRGPEKDFFEGDDEGFARHKTSILSRLGEIEAQIAASRFGPLAYVRVCMRIEAIAKSYRPNSALFVKDLFPCVGAGAPGELFFRLPLALLPRLRRNIEQAELHADTRVSREGRPYISVTRARSELGAIETIEIAPSELKRAFSAAQSVQAFLEPSVASGYIVELFERRPLDVDSADDVLGFYKIFDTLQKEILRLGNGLRASILPTPGSMPSLELLITKAREPAQIEDLRKVKGVVSSKTLPADTDTDVARHETALNILAEHPLVRRIRFPVMLELSQPTEYVTEEPFPKPSRVTNSIYPKIGIIDTGVSDTFLEWVKDRYDFLPPQSYDRNHGTMVAAIAIAARAANGPIVGTETDGCDIVDIPLMPKGRFMDIYGQRGFEAFLEELESAISEAKENHGVRVFNMSLNITAPVENNLYSFYAARLDQIQDRHGVLIINSAGNLRPQEWRKPWHRTPKQVLLDMAARTVQETIFMPCESARTVAVGAVNSPNTTQLTAAPTTYTRRGPGLRVGIKPDLAHFGGTGDISSPNITGLKSSSVDGKQIQTLGTSFAAPLVAKTLAALDAHTGQKLQPRTLRAFAIHNAKTPDEIAHRSLKELTRQFVGFGLPTSASTMLETDDHSITLVFESRLTAGLKRPAILRFPFAWPTSLVNPDTRACRGKVRMTLVYDAPLDQAFGTEFVRVNLDAKLQQRQAANRKDGTPSWNDKIDQAFLPKSARQNPPERALISHGLKWWPTKRYETNFNEGTGLSTEWRLQVESNVRAEAEFPAEGIPFSIILTIEDPDRSHPVFQEMHRHFVANRVNLQDVRTAIRLRPQSRN